MRYVFIILSFLLSSSTNSQVKKIFKPASADPKLVPISAGFNGELNQYYLYTIDEDISFNKIQFIAWGTHLPLPIALNFAIYMPNGTRMVSYVSSSYERPSNEESKQYTIVLGDSINLKKGSYYFAFNFIWIPRAIQRNNHGVLGYICADPFNTTGLPSYFYHQGKAGENLPKKIPAKILSDYSDNENKYFRKNQFQAIGFAIY